MDHVILFQGRAKAAPKKAARQGDDDYFLDKFGLGHYREYVFSLV
jgi:hypothetical protein